MMRRIRVKAELSSPQHEALLFFALSLDEQLFDMTDDSFKAPALNTFTRTLELQAVANANHAAGISKDALTPFIDELEWSVAKDPVLSSQQRALCKLHLESIRENLGESDRIARGVSGLRTVMGDFFPAIEARIRETILVRPTHKSELSALAATLIVQAEVQGFPRRHTYHVTQNSLIRSFRYKSNFDTAPLLDDFFSNFSEETKKYSCLFIGEGDFDEYPKLLQTFGISAPADSPVWENIAPDQQRFLDSKSDSQLFLLVEDVPGRSPAQAHQWALHLLEEFAGVVQFYEHRRSFSPASLALVRDLTTRRIYRIHEAPDPMHCWISHTAPSEQEMQLFVAATHGGDLSEASANKLQRALRLHRSALRSNSAENQLIDLWAALEGLVSRPGRESKRLEYFSECLLPALILCYPEKLFLSAYRDVAAIAPRARSLAMGLSGNDSAFAKFIRLTLCQGYEKERNEFIHLLQPSPLLLNKVGRLSELFKNRATTQQTLRRHRQKVAWHIARIYHTRNSIMHNASALPHLPTLVENLHVYVDTLIKAVQRTANQSPERLSVDGVLQYLAVWERYRLHAITHAGQDNESAPLDDDVWAVVFGDGLALAPRQNEEPLLPSQR